MFGNTYLTSKYLRRLQQGGGVFSPNPAQFRTPLRGINPAVISYDVNATPLDVSPLLQVMQTQDKMAMDREQLAMQRENAAIQREKLKAEADLEKSKLQYQQNKMALDFMGDMFKVTGDASMGASGNPLYVGNDLSTSKRFAPKYQEWQQKESQIVDEISKLLYAPIGSTQTGNAVMNKMLELQRHRQSAPTTMEMGADHKSVQNFWNIMAGGDKKLKVNGTLAKNVLGLREGYLNGEDNGYQLGNTINTTPGLVYNTETETEKWKNIYTEMNKPIKQESMSSDGKILSTKETMRALDPKLASQAILDRVWSDAGQKSYLSDVYGIDLWGVTPENEASVKELLRDRIQKTIEYDDQLYGGSTGITTNVSGQILSSPDKTVTMNYNVSGGTSKTINKTVTPLDPASLPSNVSANNDDTYDISKNADLVKKGQELAKKTKQNFNPNKVTQAQLEAISGASSSGSSETPSDSGAASATAKTPQELAREQFPGIYKQMEEVDKAAEKAEQTRKKSKGAGSAKKPKSSGSGSTSGVDW